MQEIFRNKGVGKKFLDGLKREAESKGFDYELCFKPEPILISGKEVASIDIMTKDGYLLASITSKNVITDEDTKVVVVPFEY